MRRLIISVIFLAGCGQSIPYPLTQQRDQSGGIGFTAGVVTARTAQKAKEIFTPEFDINVFPLRTCERIKLAIAPKPLIKCLIVPCAFEFEGEKMIDRYCMSMETEDDFWAREKKVVGLDSASANLSSLKNNCQKYPKQCKEWLGKFKGKTILFVRKKK